jgi:hypothetical protein
MSDNKFGSGRPKSTLQERLHANPVLRYEGGVIVRANTSYVSAGAYVVNGVHELQPAAGSKLHNAPNTGVDIFK